MTRDMPAYLSFSRSSVASGFPLKCFINLDSADYLIIFPFLVMEYSQLTGDLMFFNFLHLTFFVFSEARSFLRKLIWKDVKRGKERSSTCSRANTGVFRVEITKQRNSETREIPGQGGTRAWRRSPLWGVGVHTLRFQVWNHAEPDLQSVEPLSALPCTPPTPPLFKPVWKTML